MTDTLATLATHSMEVRHSRFLAQGQTADTPGAALSFIARVSDQAATHNCWAYRIGAEYRSSDDGEPSGTAGRPILAAIEGQGYEQVVMVVTRWYGGIKLGAGGLVRAYGGAAAECLRVSERRPLVVMRVLWLACAFEDLGNVHAALALHSAIKLREEFNSAGATLQLRLPADRSDALKNHLRDATRNRARFIEPDPE